MRDIGFNAGFYVPCACVMYGGGFVLRDSAKDAKSPGRPSDDATAKSRAERRQRTYSRGACSPFGTQVSGKQSKPLHEASELRHSNAESLRMLNTVGHGYMHIKQGFLVNDISRSIDYLAIIYQLQKIFNVRYILNRYGHAYKNDINICC
jgi:hypothetical protein